MWQVKVRCCLRASVYDAVLSNHPSKYSALHDRRRRRSNSSVPQSSLSRPPVFPQPVTQRQPELFSGLSDKCALGVNSSNITSHLLTSLRCDCQLYRRLLPNQTNSVITRKPWRGAVKLGVETTRLLPTTLCCCWKTVWKHSCMWNSTRVASNYHHWEVEIGVQY